MVSHGHVHDARNAACTASRNRGERRVNISAALIGGDLRKSRERRRRKTHGWIGPWIVHAVADRDDQVGDSSRGNLAVRCPRGFTTPWYW